MTIGIVVIHIADTTDGLMGVGGYGDLTLSLLSFGVGRAGGLAGGVGERADGYIVVTLLQPAAAAAAVTFLSTMYKDRHDVGHKKLVLGRQAIKVTLSFACTYSFVHGPKSIRKWLGPKWEKKKKELEEQAVAWVVIFSCPR